MSHSNDGLVWSPVARVPIAPTASPQEDFVPGLVIPLHFTAVRTGKFEIVCTQLCGLGHYNMRAYVEVMPQDRFDEWLKEQVAQQ